MSRLTDRRVLRIDLALRFVWQSTPGWTVVSLILALLQGLLPLVLLLLLKTLIDTVASSKPFSDVIPVLVLMATVALVQALLTSVARLTNEAQSLAMTDYMQSAIHTKSIEVDLEYYENAQYYDALHRAQREAPYRPLHVLQGVVQFFRSGLALLAMAGLLVSFHWLAAAVLFAAMLPGFLVRLRYSGKLYAWQHQQTTIERQAWYYDWLLTGEFSARELRLFGLGPLFRERFQNLRAQLRTEKLRIVTQQTLVQIVAQVGMVSSIYSVYGFLAYSVLQEDISLGGLMMYYQAFQRGQGALQDILHSLVGLYEDNLFLVDAYDFLELPAKIIDPVAPQPVPNPLQVGIVFDRVCFRYPNSARDVLKDISLTIRPGEKVALVGANGSGKTTLVKLLCRLYDPDSGSVMLDGIDLRQFSVQELRQSLGVTLQDYAHYNVSAKENIWFGNVELALENAAIISAAKRSGAHTVIHQLPDGYNTLLGKLFVEGEELSIGEWQQVALARAFYRKAQIIILDEPTSALDAQAEQMTFEKLSQITEDRAVLLISHRFSTTRMADRIYVLEDGCISEEGTHETLMQQDGTYARLFRLQATHYHR